MTSYEAHWDPPTVDTRQEELEIRMNQVRTALDEFVLKKKESLLQKSQTAEQTRHEQSASLSELQRDIERYTAMLQQSRQELQAAKEADEQAQKTLGLHQDEHGRFQPEYQRSKRERDALDAELRSKRKEQENSQDALVVQEQLNGPELRFYMDHTFLTIHGQKDSNGIPISDVVKFEFRCINEREWDREYSFTIDFSNDDFAVTQCEPTLPEMPTFVEELRRGGDLNRFIKQVRKAFTDVQ